MEATARGEAKAHGGGGFISLGGMLEVDTEMVTTAWTQCPGWTWLQYATHTGAAAQCGWAEAEAWAGEVAWVGSEAGRQSGDRGGVARLGRVKEWTEIDREGEVGSANSAHKRKGKEIDF